MSNGQPNFGGGAVTPTTAPVFPHERVSVRRRRARRGQSGQVGRRSGRWVVGRARHRWVRTFALCTGVLLLMALGLYFGLARQETAPSDGASDRGPASRTSVA